MKYLVLIIACFSQVVMAAETAKAKIDEIRIQTSSSNGVAYYFMNYSGWTVNDAACQAAQYAYVLENDPGSQALLSLAMASKATGGEVKFLGDCQGANYIRINYMHQY